MLEHVKHQALHVTRCALHDTRHLHVAIAEHLLDGLYFAILRSILQAKSSAPAADKRRVTHNDVGEEGVEN